ncbi:MAG: (deoxy)nucleoside triphosphate pyrophosphohydrolase [Mariprofundus sp.]|nr:(deoxy)nucleoside triphosphate pyrophosphohydrolase [Mariprofundus sp.]
MKEQAIALLALFNSCGQLLLLKRAKEQHCGGLWSFPGGKIEQGEAPLAAAIRELKEETGLTADDYRLLTQQSFTYPDRLLHFHLFSTRCLDLSGLNCESPHRWIYPKQLSQYPMPDANRELCKIVQTASLQPTTAYQAVTIKHECSI